MATWEPRISHGAPGQQTLQTNGQSAVPDAKAGRLIGALKLSGDMRQVALGSVAIKSAKGVPARAAIQLL